jgi:uncharacterized protein (TIGR03790 family)
MRTQISIILAGIFALTATSAIAQSPSTVLVVANQNNAQSIALADYYINARHIPAQNKLLVKCAAADSSDTVSSTDYTNLIATPVYNKIKMLPRIDFIVLCRNLPTKISGAGSVDSALAGHLEKGCRLNPYLNRTEAFTSAKYGIYLVTRLDGWSWDDARALVDRSLAAKPGGTMFLDVDPSKTGGYVRYNYQMQAASSVAEPGVNVVFDNTTAFVNPGTRLSGYASWGSNDAKFSSTAWKGITFMPGAIAETAVSTSAMYLRTPPSGGQSQISQLIHDGVTGIKGYVAEPMLAAIANPSIMLSRYVAGRNLAESFYAASMYICWKDVVIGDPLCSPYTGWVPVNPGG